MSKLKKIVFVAAFMATAVGAGMAATPEAARACLRCNASNYCYNPGGDGYYNCKGNGFICTAWNSCIGL